MTRHSETYPVNRIMTALKSLYYSTSVACPWLRGMGSVARRKKQTRFGGARKYFLCYVN
jgi:hypothetical protein